jgi:hypothetical protein
MKHSWMIWPLLALVSLGGCRTNPQLPVAFADHALTAQSGRVGVAMTALPKVDTSFPGAGCLLCLATAATANSSLTKHTHTLTAEDLMTLKDGIADRLRKKGVEVTVIAENLDIRQIKDFAGGGVDFAKKDFRVLKDKYKVDHLVVIDIASLGFVRNYASYISRGDPTAELEGTISVVDLSTNKYDFYGQINQSKGAEGAWDEPPNFPGLTNAYYAVIESGKDAAQQPF